MALLTILMITDKMENTDKPAQNSSEHKDLPTTPETKLSGSKKDITPTTKEAKIEKGFKEGLRDDSNTETK